MEATKKQTQAEAYPTAEIRSVGLQLLERGEAMRSHAVTHFAVARVEAVFDGKPKTVWLFNHNAERGDGSSVGPTKDGHVSTSKHSALGAYILQNRIGRGIFNNKEAEIKNLTVYTADFPMGQFDAVRGSMEFAETEGLIFRSLRSFLKELNEAGVSKAAQTDVTANIVSKEEELTRAAQELLDSSRHKEAGVLSAILEKQRYIRETNALRLAPILDKNQSRIKDLRVGDGALIIDGGPGTGKTTTLIQRIHFLIQKKILEERGIKLGERIGNDLDSDKGWIFFSPSELLKVYLNQAMSAEGLKADDKRMKVWEDYLSELFRQYGLFQAGNQKKPPFRKAQKLKESLIPNVWSKIESLMKALDKLWVEHLKKRTLVAVPELEDKELNLLRQKLRTSLGAVNEINDWVALYRFFNNYRKEYQVPLQELRAELTGLADQEASRAVVRLQQKDQALYTAIADWALQNTAETQEEGEEEDEEDDLEEEVVINEQEHGQAVLRKMRSWVRSRGMLGLKKGFSLKGRQLEWYTKVEEYIVGDGLNRIGQLAFLLRGYQKFTMGADRFMLGAIPRSYKEFRKRIISGSISSYGLQARYEAVEQLGKDRLHYEEMNFLFAWINKKTATIASRFNRHFQQSSQRYIRAYDESYRYNIVVDEASDFSLIELVAMASLNDYEYKSITLCGDLMQRMTTGGVLGWEEFIASMGGKGEVHELARSYRQTPTLLHVAKNFYKQITGKEPAYQAAAKPSPSEPAPWIKQLSSNEAISEWLTKHIVEIHESYDGKTPSIAVFCPDDNSVQEISQLLQVETEIEDAALKVQKVESDTAMVNASAICVYNIRNIKGLEFEAAFFVDIDCIAGVSDELIQKYLYVGLSRAAFYLGLSYRSKLPDSVASAFEMEDA